jgi:hypothetical protein
MIHCYKSNSNCTLSDQNFITFNCCCYPEIQLQQGITPCGKIFWFFVVLINPQEHQGRSWLVPFVSKATRLSTQPLIAHRSEALDVHPSEILSSD